MSGESRRRWHQMSVVEWAAWMSMIAILVALLAPSVNQVRGPHGDSCTTERRAGVWLAAAREYEKQNGRLIQTVEELEEFVFSDACKLCNVPDVSFDWWGTPFRIWIDHGKRGGRHLNVQSARWNNTFEEDDRTWRIDLAESEELGVPVQSEPMP